MQRTTVSPDVAAGKASWKGIMQDFWHPFDTQLHEVGDIGVREVIDELNAALGPHLFPPQVCRSHEPLYPSALTPIYNFQ